MDLPAHQLTQRGIDQLVTGDAAFAGKSLRHDSGGIMGVVRGLHQDLAPGRPARMSSATFSGFMRNGSKCLPRDLKASGSRRVRVFLAAARHLTLPGLKDKRRTPMTAATAARTVEDATLLAAARRALAIEARAVDALGARLGPQFVAACRLCLACSGRVIVTGIGKSGHVARKIAATLASTGTPGFFLHAAEASHGDLGMITASDVVLALSNSGESPELVFLLPHLKRLATPLITLTGNLTSTLARNATVALDVRARGGLPAEPRAHGQHHRDARHGRRAGRHPAGGAWLHRQRLRPLAPGRVAGAAVVPAGRGHHAPRRDLPRIAPTATLAAGLLEMSRKGLGMTVVVDAEDSRARGSSPMATCAGCWTGRSTSTPCTCGR